MQLKLVLILSLTAIAALFVLQNTDVVELRFLFWSASMSRALLFVLILLIGMGLGWLLHSYFAFRHGRKGPHERLSS